MERNSAKKYGWNMSPITRGQEICYTAADPIHYPDDDMFGYMRAPKKVKMRVIITV